MPPSLEQKQDRQAQHRLAVLRHAEEVTGNVALSCHYYGITQAGLLSPTCSGALGSIESTHDGGTWSR